MTENVMPDPATPFGERVARRLRTEIVIWLTTVGADGTPQPNPVWFLVIANGTQGTETQGTETQGTELLIYNLPDALRLGHIRRNPRVALHFDGDGHGGDIVVLAGHATILDNQAPAHEVPAYMEKYATAASRVSGDVASFSAEYSVAIRVDIERVRGH